MLDPIPWTANELQDLLCDHLLADRANMARWVVEAGFLDYGRVEEDPLGHFQTVDVHIMVDREHNPAAVGGVSMAWRGGKHTHEQEIRIRTEEALREIFADQERVKLGALRFVEVSTGALSELAAARAALMDRGATNQANVHPESPAKIRREGLRFRSYAEVRVWNALIENLEAGESVAPLPVVAWGHFKRIEPDFLVFLKGKQLLIEVDGPSHTESAVEASERTKVLEGCGFEVWRLSVVDVDSPKKAEARVRDILERTRAGIPRVTT